MVRQPASNFQTSGQTRRNPSEQGKLRPALLVREKVLWNVELHPITATATQTLTTSELSALKVESRFFR